MGLQQSRTCYNNDLLSPFSLQIYANLFDSLHLCNFSAKREAHFVVFWTALCALFFPTSTWHAEAPTQHRHTVSGRYVRLAHISVSVLASCTV